MAKTYCKWDDEEVKELFLFIEVCKEKHYPLSLAFEEYASKSGRMPNSVRNYYYLELEELLHNRARQIKLGINLAHHKKQNFQEFTKQEEMNLVYQILKKNREGKSVRSACLELAENDIDKMIRYQNKFRSILKNNVPLIKEIEAKLEEQFGKQEDRNAKVLYFPKKQNKSKLTDEELKGLFMGLVKLVKKSADLEMSGALKKECDLVSENYKKALVEMKRKEEAILNLASTNQILEDKVKALENQILKLRIDGMKSIKSQDLESKN